jgi:hypothetical protein
MQRGTILVCFTLLWSLGPASGLAQDETSACSADDLYFLGVGTGLNDGIGFRTQFQLRNLGDEAVAGRILLFQNSGEPWDIPLTAATIGGSNGEAVSNDGVTEILIPAQSTLILTLESRDSSQLGWSCLSQDPDLNSRVELQVARLRDPSPVGFENFIDRISEIKPVRADRRFVVPIHYFSGGRLISTAFAASNTSAGRGEITAVLAPAAPGGPIERTITLDPGESIADYWDHFWGVAHPLLFGLESWETAEISADFPIAVAVQSTLDGFPVSGVTAIPRPTEHSPVSATIGDEIELAVGEKVAFGDDLSVEFWNVPADSRCPTDGLIVCVWQGEAVIELKVDGPSVGKRTVQLTDYGGRNAAVVGDFRIELQGVEPPAVSTHRIAIEDYRIRIVVQKIASN